MANAAFPLGVYVGQPNGSDPTAEAIFEATYSGFVATLGTTPTYLDTYVDYTQTQSNWISNASWQAWSDAQSPDAKNMTPVIGLPLASTASGAPSSDTQYRQVASGQYDSVYQGIVQAYAAQGYTTLVLRPGWEMNLQGPTYAGDTAQDQADWVAAYQRVYTVVHQEAANVGINVTVVWNPSATNYSNANAITSLYPGNAYVDAIGADVYSNMYPYSDGNNSAGQPTYHDWDTRQEDTSLAQWMADPINREHYWTYPAATEWQNDSSSGHATSLDDLLQFAEQRGKPFAIPETGAGNSNAGTDVNDDAAFSQWLAQQLDTAQAAGETIDFVNIWDSNGGGNYEFSNASDGKPLEAAAWAQYFGAPSVTTPGVPAPITLGSGSDQVVLAMSEDAYQGDAEVAFSVDGTQIGETETITASHAAGDDQSVILLGNWGPGQHTVSVNFLNDAYGGSASLDRNAYVDQASYDGTVAPGNLALWTSGSQSLTVGTPATVPGPTTLGSGSDTVTLEMNEDFYEGNAEFTVSVDGIEVGGTQTVSASHSQGQQQTFQVEGDWGSGQLIVSVDFLNDAYGGSSSADRNLYVTGASYDGTAQPTASLALYGAGSQSFTATSATTYNEGAAAATVTTNGNDIVNIGTGDVTINAAGPSTTVNGGAGTMTFIAYGGDDTIFAGSGASTVTGSAGSLLFTEGSGASTVTEGSGKSSYDILMGEAGGSLTINDLRPGMDSIHLGGYTGTGIQSQTVTGGSTHIVLTDNTAITLTGITSTGGYSLFS